MSGNRQGFTLLEVIVAMVLIATLGIALFSWITVTLSNLHHTERIFETERANANAIAWLATINPLHEPDGETTLGDTRIIWHATPSAPVRRCQAFSSLVPSIFEAGLYRVRVRIFKGTELISVFDIQRTGWNQTGITPESTL